jgi:hypothetical protein
MSPFDICVASTGLSVLMLAIFIGSGRGLALVFFLIFAIPEVGQEMHRWNVEPPCTELQIKGCIS